MNYLDIAVWIAAGLLLLGGLLGSVIPLLPGTTLMLLGVLLQKWLLPATLGWGAVSWIAAVWLFSIVADLICTLIGTRVFGGSRWGMAGASGGALAGMLFSLPALLFGTLFGAVVAEKLGGKRTDEDSIKSGVGAALGFLAGTVVRFACALVILGIYLLAILTTAPTAP